MSQQFPSKFGTLPQISAQNSPDPGGQLVPLNRVSIDGLEAEEKIKQLETRINVTEKSNRALLEEVVRLQSELKGNGRRSDEMMREEKSQRSQLEQAMRYNNDVIAQLSSRLGRAEERATEERSAISSLVSHTKSVEQAVIGSQQELLGRRDTQNQKIADLKNELDEVNRGKEGLERLSYQIVDEVRQLKNKLDSQSTELQQSSNELKNKSKKLEEENRQMKLDNLRKQNETTNHTDQSATQLRSQIETRLAELRDIIVELRNKQDSETQERRLLEQQIQVRVNDLHTGLAEQTRKREESLHALDVVQREREHAAENERIRLQGRIAEIAEEVSKKILHKEIKLREEATDKFSKIEKFIHDEHGARVNYESNIRDDVEQRWQELNKMQEDQLRAIKDMQKLDRQKYSETIQKLDEALNILEEQVDEQKKQYDKVMAAEIKSRKQHEAFTLEKVEDLQQKLSLGITTLQQAIGGVTTQFEKEIKQLKKDSARAGKAGTEAGDKADTLNAAQMARFKKEIQETVSTNEEKIDDLLKWQSSLKQTIKDLERVRELPDDMYSLEEKLNKKQKATEKKIGEESESRNRDVENIRRDMARVGAARAAPGGGPVAAGLSREDQEMIRRVKMDMEEAQTSIRKLAESVQTVKTVLGMKIQSEEKARVKDVEKIEGDLDDLKLQIEPLTRTKPVPRLFIKESRNMDRDEAEKGQPGINKWSLYAAYRWSTFKMKFVGKKSKRSSSPTTTVTETEATTTEPTTRRDASSPTETEATTTAPTKTGDSDSETTTTGPAQAKEEDSETETEATTAVSDRKKKPSARAKKDDDTETEATTTAKDDDDEDDDDEDGTTTVSDTTASKKKPPAKKKDETTDDETETAEETEDDEESADDDDDEEESETETEVSKKKPAAKK